MLYCLSTSNTVTNPLKNLISYCTTSTESPCSNQWVHQMILLTPSRTTLLHWQYCILIMINNSRIIIEDQNRINIVKKWGWKSSWVTIWFFGTHVTRKGREQIFMNFELREKILRGGRVVSRDGKLAWSCFRRSRVTFTLGTLGTTYHWLAAAISKSIILYVHSCACYSSAAVTKHSSVEATYFYIIVINNSLKNWFA